MISDRSALVIIGRIMLFVLVAAGVFFVLRAATSVSWSSLLGGGSSSPHYGGQTTFQQATVTQTTFQQAGTTQAPFQQVTPPSSVQLTNGRYVATGQGQTKTYNVDLKAGMAVIGQSYGFQGNNTGCQVFLIAGPYRGQVTVTDGESFVFDSGNLSSSQEEELLRQAAAKQASQGYGCSSANQHITRLGGSSSNGTGTVVTTAPTSTMQRIDIGENVWNGAQLTVPAGVVGSDELFIAHGDVLGDGGCHLMVFRPGQTISVPSNGTWKLVEFKGGTVEQREQQISIIQGQLGTCPLVGP